MFVERLTANRQWSPIEPEASAFGCRGGNLHRSGDNFVADIVALENAEFEVRLFSHGPFLVILRHCQSGQWM